MKLTYDKDAERQIEVMVEDAHFWVRNEIERAREAAIAARERQQEQDAQDIEEMRQAVIQDERQMLLTQAGCQCGFCTACGVLAGTRAHKAQERSRAKQTTCFALALLTCASFLVWVVR